MTSVFPKPPTAPMMLEVIVRWCDGLMRPRLQLDKRSFKRTKTL